MLILNNRYDDQRMAVYTNLWKEGGVFYIDFHADRGDDNVDDDADGRE